MTLIKTSLLNAIAVIVKMMTLLGINKILAVYVGPSGYAVIGQFQNAVQMISVFASGAISNGVTKYTAEFNDEEENQRKVWRTAGTLSLLASIITAIVVVIFSKSLAIRFLNDEVYSDVFVWFALSLILLVLNTILLAILNGKKEIHRYVVANIAGSLFSLIITTCMVISYGLYGALTALAVYQSLSFFATLALCYKANWFKFEYLFGEVDRDTAINLGKFTAMALTSVICVPLSHILVRSHLGDTLGWEAAGYWEAMWRLSAAYLMLVTTTLSIYYLPRLSELKEPGEIRQEILNGYKIILPVAAISSLVIYFLRDFIIRALFTIEFSQMEVLFTWQLIGDVFKIASWLLGFILVAKALFSLFIVSEMLFAFLFFLLVYYLTPLFGIEATSIAHAVNYFLHFVFMFVALKVKKII